MIDEGKLIYLDKEYEIGIFKEATDDILAKEIIKELDEYFAGKRKVFDIPLEFIGTDFQKRTWNELIKIPYGVTRSYQEVAQSLGDLKLARAVGNANGRNKIIILIPCHRVIKKDNSLGGYTGGLDIKEKLLKLESENKDD